LFVIAGPSNWKRFLLNYNVEICYCVY
jgi:hypothetical protein